MDANNIFPTIDFVNRASTTIRWAVLNNTKKTKKPTDSNSMRMHFPAEGRTKAEYGHEVERIPYFSPIVNPKVVE